MPVETLRRAYLNTEPPSPFNKTEVSRDICGGINCADTVLSALNHRLHDQTDPVLKRVGKRQVRVPITITRQIFLGSPVAIVGIFG